jgi:hypothetical protein
MIQSMNALVAVWLGVVESPPGAQGFAIRDISKHWGGASVIDVQWLFIAAGVVIVFVSGLSLHRWWKHRHSRPSPVWVFLAICHELKLGMADQWLLWRIARHQQLPTPLTLLLSRSTLGFHAQAYASSLSESRKARVLRRSTAIGRQLFEVTAPGDPLVPPASARAG